MAGLSPGSAPPVLESAAGPATTLLEELRAEVLALRGLIEGQRPPELLTVPEAAKQLGISRSCLYELMESGELAYVLIGRARRIERAAIERFIAANRRG